MTTTVGFIGLGIMGAPMATNLVGAGFDVVGHNRSPAKTNALVARGGRAAATVAEAARDADVVVTMLPDSTDVLDVVLGEGGVLAHAHEGQLLIDMSTVAPEASREIAAAAAGVGVRALDAPVSGGEAGAVEGSLSIMVGGAAADLEGAQPILSAIGTTIVHVGPAGAGQTVKAANQLIVAGHLQVLAEALVFLDASGVDLDAAVRVLGGGLAGSTVLTRKAPAMLARDFAPGFRLALHHKDLGILTQAAREAGVVIPVGAAVAQLVAALVARGDGQLDHSALLKLVTELSSPDRTEP
ncbi:MAG TPA: 2-hydroxy-3-oxopropionate reductase [Nocardioides sp.]|uniref:2-hydroxy-3-oxopropionate reductase n=1 Tax=uncultured Nocardioides sp. TaxID=198441 RepID=UPI00262F484D|nr:2-hydroxy-3-oxopropionate reductase [uncultured Nocardioides sp.]HRD59454.1 2-hydroxy-3-oxopropionate reductase [Nocardioides sp.]HRI96729.1 2-hydroxy-3-oxopropionate reductase [Nocardioides sp.]